MLKKLGKGLLITAISLIGIVVFFIVLLALGGALDGNPNPPAETISQEVPTAPIVEPVEYTIVSSEDASAKAMTRALSSYSQQELNTLPTNKKIIYRVVVEPGIRRAQVRATMEKIVADITASDRDIDEIGIFMYDNTSLADGAWNVASGVWAPGGQFGNVTPDIARTNLRNGYDLTVRFGAAVN